MTTYINKQYGIEIPTLYDRRMYYMTTGNYWWEQWLKVKEVPKKPTKKCPYCDWETEDVDNNSGAFENHLKKIHNITKMDYILNHPEEKKYFLTAFQPKNTQIETDPNKFVTCKICGKKFIRIDNNHLKLHGIDKIEYIRRFGVKDLSSVEYHKRQSQLTTEMNMNSTFFKHSANEQKIFDYLTERGVNCYTDKKILHGRELDIYSPEHKIAIEYNGLLWHSEQYGKDSNYHLNKTEECESNGISLIQIFEDEYVNNEEIVMSKINHIFGLDVNKPKVYGRKCQIKKIQKSVSDAFLQKNHIQGEVNATIYLGCFHNNDIVGVMTFLRENDNNWCLSRFATDITKHCVGVGGKLFKYFIDNFQYKQIKSFADRRWTSLVKKNLYDRLGFKLMDITKPDYKYFNNRGGGCHRIHKFSCRKQILIKKYAEYGLTMDMTETEMVGKLGFHRIWDCGLIKYVYDNPSYIVATD